MANNCFVAISGNIGVGKTTWTKYLSRHFGCVPHFEKVIENPYIEDFYHQMDRWGFHSQIFFLTQRLKIHLEIQQSRQACIQDRTIYEDCEIFARNLFDSGTMSERDFNCYYDFYETVIKFLRYPDVLLYLRSSIDGLISRIKMRGRGYEAEIPIEYLKQLNQSYDRWVQRMEQYTKIVIIDTEKVDILQQNTAFQKTLSKLGALLKLPDVHDC
ncbi:deoxynucleoside kinase [candidate division KSB1 bacterium]|nr:deoxynucleoside kinase [candidate division KSB1 bacterium]